ncbi:hypothetical protein Kpol_274p4 [Vanderwaltozyma polyspora DSM 70294]|uniref:Chromatin assembly factor 1 subunit p90 n=1 Tax=Vanderwaltozyma polyspora (strain ATCC 22028 / DSM 70294 / BCRC 21397 / CBS 2163 / NBRC 10782 / NRRL Y-8283 / UCD 57-17) TaxID=436907 RepID=A7TT85_VANPO|nr:uncharacterized protein Kpol_274p4 [Vanderwaltozyma polyspora DSM 70294]EDO14521.1 hypothetical protein Kpol_274p4 [Vanderwaltozyma polyspora DSM 70294]
MTSPEKESSKDGNKQGILTFFQNNTPSKKKINKKNISKDISKDDTGNKIEIIDLDIDHPIEKNNLKEVETELKNDSTVKLNDSVEQKDNKQEVVDSDKDEDTKLSKKDLAAIRREKLKEEKELKRLEREKEKQKKEAQRLEEKSKRESKLEEEKRKREEKAAEVKRRREALKLQKEEEKRKKEEERLETKRKREEEKLKIEEEKRLKEEAKERAQSRIGNFFKKVRDSSNEESTRSDYEKIFLKFHAKEGINISKGFKLSESTLKEKINEIDSLLRETNEDNEDVSQWIKSRTNKRGYKIKSTAVSVLQQMTSKDKTDEELQVLLSLVPNKYIKFYENVRPPYIGTYSKDIVIPVDNPFTQEGTGYNYDYDSDLEWVEEDEEGADAENLESGEEDEEDDDEEEEASEGEFDGFLDTEDKTGETKKRKYAGPLIPTVYLRTDIETLDKENQEYFEKVAVQYLIKTQKFPIDPKKSSILNNNASPSKRALTDSSNSGVSTQGNSPMGSPEKKAKTIITEVKDLITLFEELIDSSFSLATMTEIVQKTLPQYNKQTIKNTVKEYAIRGTGKGDTPRTWSLKDGNQLENLRQNQESLPQ